MDNENKKSLIDEVDSLVKDNEEEVEYEYIEVDEDENEEGVEYEYVEVVEDTEENEEEEAKAVPPIVETKTSNNNDNNNKKVLIIVGLIAGGIALFFMLYLVIISMFSNKELKLKDSNSNESVSNENIESNSNSNSNEMNDNPDYQIIATFVANGANIDKEESMCITEKKEEGCVISAPNITREGASIIGFSTNKDAKTAEIRANERVTIKEDTTYYAITKLNVEVTFKYPNKEKKDETQKCLLYNEEKDCTIVFPKYTSEGNYEGTWSNQSDLKGEQYLSGTKLNMLKSTTFYASYHHPEWKESSNDYIDMDIDVMSSSKIGNLTIEYEEGISQIKIANHNSFMKKIYNKNPWLFKDGKMFVLTEESYDKYSIPCDSSIKATSYNYLYLKYNGEIDENETIHALAHGWDENHKYKKGASISGNSDLVKFYNKLGSSKRNNLSLKEWFAEGAVDYYRYLNEDKSYDSKSGYLENYTEEEQQEFINIYSKYAK